MRCDVFSIGHSNHPIEMFLRLLQEHGIEAVADVRSNPHSRFATQYDRAALRQVLEANGVRYIYLGRELGGRPEGSEFYDDSGHVLYGSVAQAEFFQQGIERLKKGMGQFRVAMVCAEEDPAACHRRLLITRVLREQGIAVGHIRASGVVLSEEELLAAEATQEPQLALFEHAKLPEWKSIPSVLHKRQPSASSAS